jgi:hypothetical protein
VDQAGASGPRFEAEAVRIAILGEEFEVEGSYLFRRDAARASFPILYPFPADTTLGPPRLLAARISCDGGAEGDLGVSSHADGLRFRLPFDAADSCRVRIRYRQPARANRAVYVLRSTRAWGQALARASFVVTAPAEAGSLAINYPVRRGASAGDTACAFEASPFLPDRDLVIRWRGAAGRGARSSPRDDH